MQSDALDSPSLAKADIDNVRRCIDTLDQGELIDALKRLDRAYDEFPELELDCPRGELLEDLRSAAESMPDRTGIALLMYCVAASPSDSSSLASLVEKIVKSDYCSSLSAVLRWSCRGRTFCWRTIEPIVASLLRQSRTEIALQLISAVLGGTSFAKEDDVSRFGDTLKRLLSDQHRLTIDSAMLAQALRSARRRLNHPSLGQNGSVSRAALLAMAERLRPTLSAAPLRPHPDLAWPSGRVSFDEFLLQWPCEVELSVELDDTAFIDKAYRALLLRAPDIAERNQYLTLLKDGAASKSWIIEDLLASEEIRALERRVRVICGGHVITEPGSSEEEMPAVTWLSKSAG
jgi:hypothetical protein